MKWLRRRKKFPFIAITSIPTQRDWCKTGKLLYLRQMLRKQQMNSGAESRERAKARSE